MKILYICHYPVTYNTGKARATRHKLEAFNMYVDLKVVTPRPSRTFLGKLYQAFVIEVKSVYLLIFSEKFDCCISRGSGGFSVALLKNFYGYATVREVHANGFEEAKLYPGSYFQKITRKIGVRIAHWLDSFADMRIFNNPLLLAWYKNAFQKNNSDIFVYNGCDIKSRSSLNRDSARKLFDLPYKKKILVFNGSASIWHGVEYLVKLQEKFDFHGDPFQIVCGGGVIDRNIDPESRLINLAPLDDEGCANLIRASDACLLPVKNIRVSPGSPLKLYDYILNGGFVFTQCNTLGYSDEVLRYKVGLPVDFTSPDLARSFIVNNIPLEYQSGYDHLDDKVLSKISWEGRMAEWFEAITSLCGRG